MKQISKLLNLAHNVIIIMGALLFSGLVSSNVITGQTSNKNISGVLDEDFYKGSVIRIKFLKDEYSQDSDCKTKGSIQRIGT